MTQRICGENIASDPEIPRNPEDKERYLRFLWEKMNFVRREL